MDKINPPHYKKGKIECIDYIQQQIGSGFPSYLEASIIKYIHRHNLKGENISDLKKARWFLDKLIEYYEEL
jgi:hypothetical protein